MERLADEPRALTAVEARLVQWGLSERAAIALAHTVPENPTEAEITTAVIDALVKAKESISGSAEVIYLCGERRDTLRGHS
jgi:hypothetical protein